jgi:hypothetical protein
MRPFDQFWNWLNRLSRPQMPDLIVDADGFTIIRQKAKTLNCAKWSAVERINAFKRDYGMYDEICLGISIGDPPETIEISEAFGGYEQFTQALNEHFAPMDKDWWRKVAFPAFATNQTVIYDRVRST